jgi:hypothetical protein
MGSSPLNSDKLTEVKFEPVPQIENENNGQQKKSQLPY